MELEKLSNKELKQLHDDLNHWRWNEVVGEAPNGWDEMGVGRKYSIVKPILIRIETEQWNRKNKQLDRLANVAIFISIIALVVTIASIMRLNIV